MTALSVNLNKIALLRNSRGRDYPNVVEFAKKFIALGVEGITVHPRQDERHITRRDAYELGELLVDYPNVEYNIEGFPSDDFLELVHAIKPDQCTLVPDSPEQLTSDHGWDLKAESEFLLGICSKLNEAGVRSALFLDPDMEQLELVPATQAQRIELYTEEYAEKFSLLEIGGLETDTENFQEVFDRYDAVAKQAQLLGIGVNAGHDLDLSNLQKFLTIDNILEVSIGHALTIESIEQGTEKVVSNYLSICHS